MGGQAEDFLHVPPHIWQGRESKKWGVSACQATTPTRIQSLPTCARELLAP